MFLYKPFKTIKLFFINSYLCTTGVTYMIMLGGRCNPARRPLARGKDIDRYLPKSKVLTGDQVLAFIKDASNETFLLHKVVLVMGVFGALRRDEMVKLIIDDIEGPVLPVKVPETKTGDSKGFALVEEAQIGALKLIRQYAASRPGGNEGAEVLSDI